MNVDEVRAAQSSAIREKAQRWRGFIGVFADEVRAAPDYWLERRAALWASTFSHIGWLASFHFAKFQVVDNDVDVLLNQKWGWPKQLGRLFWKSGRNPIAHVGQANPFHSYLKVGGHPTNVSLNDGQWSKEVVEEWPQYHPVPGVSIAPLLDMGDGNGPFLPITFFHQMIHSDLLPVLADSVASKISAEKDPKRLARIVELNHQIPH